MIFISVLLLIALDIRSCAKTREVTLVHELEIPAYTEYNLGTAASDKVTKLLHYERASIFNPLISTTSMNMGTLLSGTEALYHHAAAVLWSTSERSSCLANFAMSVADLTTDIYLLQSVLHDILDVAHEQDPRATTPLLNMGKLSNLIGQPELALRSFNKVLDIDSHHALALMNIGNYYFELGLVGQSLTWYNRAMEALDATEIDTRVMVLNNIGQCYRELGQLRQSISSFSSALDRLSSTDKTRLHDWTVSNYFAVATIAAWWKNYELTEEKFERGAISSLTNTKTLEGGAVDCYTYMLTRYSRPRASRSLARHNCMQYIQTQQQDVRSTHERRPVRVGYLSYDWRNHPMGRLTQKLVTRHNGEDIVSYCFSYGPNDRSEERAYVESRCSHFYDFHNIASDEVLAAKILQHDIDILVDLTSLTYKGRVGIALHGPARIIVNYLGYPGTTGCNAFDYSIVDVASVPVEISDTFSEKLAYLPYTYQANSMPLVEHTPVETAMFRKNGMQLCSFNAIKKIEPNVFQAWMNIMRSLPAAILVLVEADNYIKNNLLLEAAFAGVHTTRIIFWTKMPWREHLSRIPQCDVVLDTFVYGAHTTASDVLWMGVPIISVAGWGNNEMPSRVASGLVATIGGAAKVAIADSIKEYEAISRRFGTRRRLQKFVSDNIKKRNAGSALFNSDLMQAEIEKTYEFMINIDDLSTANMNIILPKQPYFERKIIPIDNEKLPVAYALCELSTVDLPALEKVDDFGLKYAMEHCRDAVLRTIRTSLIADMACEKFYVLDRFMTYLLDHWNVQREWIDVADSISSDDVYLFVEIASSTNITSISLPSFRSEDLAAILHDMAMMHHCIGKIDALQYMMAAYFAHSTWIRKLNIGLLLQDFGYYDIGFYVASRAIVENHKHVQVDLSWPHVFSAPRVTFYCNEYGNSWWPSWDPTFVETGGLGGSEEAVVYLAQAMVDLGYNVTVYGEMSGGAFSGVLYQHISMFNVLDPGDIFIAWRYPLSMELGKFAKVKLLWLHDILKSHLFPSNVSSYVDSILVPSNFHASKFSGRLQNLLQVLPHGVPSNYLIDGPNLNHVFIYGSSPNRGLEVVLEEWSTIRAAIPNARLEVYYGFNDVVNARLSMSMGPENFAIWRDKMFKLLAQEGVHYFGTVNHRSLSEAYARAGFVLYPTRFPETGCISVIKAMAMGAIPITSRFVDSALLQLTDGFDLVRVPFSRNMSFGSWLDFWREAIFQTRIIPPATLNGIRTDMKKYIRSLHSWTESAAKLDKIVNQACSSYSSLLSDEWICG